MFNIYFYIGEHLSQNVCLLLFVKWIKRRNKFHVINYNQSLEFSPLLHSWNFSIILFLLPFAVKNEKYVEKVFFYIFLKKEIFEFPREKLLCTTKK